ncbi:hypothetical protein HAX54_014154 [Datura stramonium]|uniref:Pectinesterase catalytic domain-containing protein n=1 Tax=Datura stramonium TaxID=4076 RepID=A0ABS8TPF7_DATST|nr:hypothetical protein [Datura stramonium]
MDSTIITGNRSFIDGNKTYDSATVRVFGIGFTAQDITFRNDAGPIKHQAVALMVKADFASFYRCRFDGTVIMESYIGNLINPKGWIEWTTDKSDIRHPYYLEYKNRGPGAITEGRVTWAFVTTNPNIASNFTARHFINGDKWIPATIPHYLDFS